MKKIEGETGLNKLPLDHPSPYRPHRVYAALTNHCNRSCPWCCTYSSPLGRTWLSMDDFSRGLPEAGMFEVQLEGGEPTIHPDFWLFVSLSRRHARCARLVLCTNGVALPRQRQDIREYVERLGQPLTIKLSINHHLFEHDPALVLFASELRDVMLDLGGDRQLILNVRLRKSAEDHDEWVIDAVKSANLTEYANVFSLQRYGFASGHREWDAPFLVGHNFRMINPDGTIYGPDLIARAEGMRRLP